MAITTSTVRADQIATLISQETIKAASPDIVFSKLMHRDYIDGMGALTKDYPVYTDLATATAGTEGTAASNTHTLDLATKVTATPTEGVLMQAEITDRALGAAYGMVAQAVVKGAIANENAGVFINIIRADIERMTQAAMKKIESDAIALMASASTSVGTTTTALTIVDAMTAIYTADLNNMRSPNSIRGFALAPKAIHELNLEAISTSGGLSGALWSNQADFKLMNRTVDNNDGFAGTFLGFPVFRIANALKTTVNSDADHLGFFGGLGDPNLTPEQAQSRGALGFGSIVFNSPISFAFSHSDDQRSIKITCKADYDVIEMLDANGIKIVSAV